MVSEIPDTRNLKLISCSSKLQKATGKNLLMVMVETGKFSSFLFLFPPEFKSHLNYAYINMDFFSFFFLFF